MGYGASTLQLSATELKALTGWNDSVIIEFLSLQGGMTEVTQNISIVINNVAQAFTEISLNTANIATMEKQFQPIREQIAELNSLHAKVANMKRDVLRLVNNIVQEGAATLALARQAQAKVESLEDQIIALTQSGAALQSQNGYLSAQLHQANNSLADLSQQVAGMA